MPAIFHGGGKGRRTVKGDRESFAHEEEEAQVLEGPVLNFPASELCTVADSKQQGQQSNSNKLQNKQGVRC